MPQNGMYAPPGLLPNIKGGAYIAFFAMCAMRVSALGHSITGGRTHATKRHVCATRTAGILRAMRASKHAALLKPEAAHMPQNGMYAPPGLLPIIAGGAYIALFAMCAMRGSKHASIL